MKNFKISEEEKNQILESHNSFRDVLMGHLFDKNLMTEQQSLTAPEANPAGYAEPMKVLQDAQKKCTAGSPLTKGTITKVTGKGDAIKYVHAAEDPQVGATAGDTTYYYGDFTYQTVTTPQGGRQQIKVSGKWMCKALNVETGQCDAMKKDKKSQAFMDIQELSAAGGATLVNNPAMVEIITVCGEKLYRVNQQYRNQYQALTSDQKAYLDELYGIGGDNKLQLDPVTGAEVASKWVLAKNANQKQINQIGFKEIIIKPASNNPFDYPVTIYLKVEGEDRVKGSDLAAAKERFKSETDSRQYCNNVIDVFYNAFILQGTSNLSPAEFNKFKTDVTACAKRAILLKDVNLDRNARARLTALMGNASAGLRVPDRNSTFLINIEPPRTPRQQ
jgi:hypothetical protein